MPGEALGPALSQSPAATLLSVYEDITIVPWVCPSVPLSSQPHNMWPHTALPKGAQPRTTAYCLPWVTARLVSHPTGIYSKAHLRWRRGPWERLGQPATDRGQPGMLYQAAQVALESGLPQSLWDKAELDFIFFPVFANSEIPPDRYFVSQVLRA